MLSAPHMSPRRALLACVHVVLTVVVCAALIVLAVLAPAPPEALPTILVACVGLPMCAGHQLPLAAAYVRDRLGRRHLRRLRRELARLPEVPHPLEMKRSLD